MMMIGPHSRSPSSSSPAMLRAAPPLCSFTASDSTSDTRTRARPGAGGSDSFTLPSRGQRHGDLSAAEEDGIVRFERQTSVGPGPRVTFPSCRVFFCCCFFIRLVTTWHDSTRHAPLGCRRVYLRASVRELPRWLNVLCDDRGTWTETSFFFVMSVAPKDKTQAWSCFETGLKPVSKHRARARTLMFT